MQHFSQLNGHAGAEPHRATAKRGRPRADRTAVPVTATFDEISAAVRAIPKSKRSAAKEHAIGAASSDRRLTGSAGFVVLTTLMNALFWKEGAARLGAGSIAYQTGCTRRTVERALRLLVALGYLLRRVKWKSQVLCDTAETTFPTLAANFLTVPSAVTGGSRQPRRGGTVTGDGVPFVSPSDVTSDEVARRRKSSKRTDGDCGPLIPIDVRGERADSAVGYRAGASGTRLPFTEDVLAEIASLGVDPEALYRIYLERTAARHRWLCERTRISCAAHPHRRSQPSPLCARFGCATQRASRHLPKRHGASQLPCDPS